MNEEDADVSLGTYQYYLEVKMGVPAKTSPSTESKLNRGFVQPSPFKHPKPWTLRPRPNNRNHSNYPLPSSNRSSVLKPSILTLNPNPHSALTKPRSGPQAPAANSCSMPPGRLRPDCGGGGGLTVVYKV